MFEQLFQQPGNKTFLEANNKQYTYQWLQQQIKKTIGLWASLQISRGDRLLLAVSDDTEMSVIFLSALASGVAVVIADPDMKAPRARSIAERSQPACIIADKESLDRWQLTLSGNCRVIPYQKENPAKPGLLSKFLQKNKPEPLSNDYRSLLEKAIIQDELPEPPPPEALAYIIFTSGTTADSKGVAITHGNLAAHLSTLQKVYSLDAEGRILNQLLLCHADGCIQGPLLAAYVGCGWHRPFRFSIERIRELLDYCYASNVSHMVMVPAMLNMIVQFSEGYEDSFTYPEFKALISVSAHLDAPLWDHFETVFKVPVSNVYGLTETVAGSLFSGPLQETYRRYTVGKPVDCQVRIVDDQSEDVRPGAVGELCLRGAHIMKGYWGDAKATQEAFSQGWFHTGDLASQDADGFITIKGRKKNLIISGGINIHPEEVTECLLAYPEIVEACALGVPDEVFGEKLVAAVVPKQGVDVEAFSIAEHCRQFLDDKKVPHRIHILSELPKGVSGKVQLNVLREQLGQLPQPGRQAGGECLVEKVLEIASEVFQVPASRLSVRDNSNTVAGWDSMAHLIFITTLEEKFNVQFRTAEVITMNSIQKAVDLIKQRNA